MSDPAQKPTLKPCPFCGHAASIQCCEVASDDNFGGRWVECDNCHACTVIVFPVADCVDAALADIWNRRVMPAPFFSETMMLGEVASRD